MWWSVSVREDLEKGGVRIGFVGLFLAVSQMGKCYLLAFFETTAWSSSRWRSSAQTTQSALEPHSHIKTVLVSLNTYVCTKKHNYVSIQH